MQVCRVPKVLTHSHDFIDCDVYSYARVLTRPPGAYTDEGLTKAPLLSELGSTWPLQGCQALFLSLHISQVYLQRSTWYKGC